MTMFQQVSNTTWTVWQRMNSALPCWVWEWEWALPVAHIAHTKRKQSTEIYRSRYQKTCSLAVSYTLSYWWQWKCMCINWSLFLWLLLTLGEERGTATDSINNKTVKSIYIIYSYILIHMLDIVIFPITAHGHGQQAYHLYSKYKPFMNMIKHSANAVIFFKAVSEFR